MSIVAEKLRQTKRISVLLLLVAVVAVITGCANTESHVVIYYASTGGTIHGEYIQNVENGGNALSVTAVPDEGYVFVEWSDGKTEPQRTDTNVTENLQFTAKFEKAPEEEIITVKVHYSAEAGGAVDGKTDQTVVYGEAAQPVTAVAANGYRFVKWSDGKTDPARHDSQVVAEINVAAEFEFLFAGERGTEEDPFGIRTYEQLRNMIHYPTACYVLENDIDLGKITHEPIFTSENRFRGVFDGGGHTVKNMKIDSAVTPSLFGFIGDKGKVHSLNITNFELTVVDTDSNADNMYTAGAVAGVSYGDLEDITVTGKIKGDGLNHNGVAVGALVGFTARYVKRCEANVTVELCNITKTETETATDTDFNVGGLIGIGSAAVIEDCNVIADITVAQSNRDIHIGGMIGRYSDSLANFTAGIKNCTVDLAVTDSEYAATVGGLACTMQIAANAIAEIENCNVKNNITASTVGGFIYKCGSVGKVTIKNCPVENNVTAGHAAAGFMNEYRNNNQYFIIDALNPENNLYADDSIVAPDNGQSAISIIDCTAKNIIEASTVGGFFFDLDNNSDESQIQNCSTDNNITAKSAVAGFAYKIVDINIADCYALGRLATKTRDNGESAGQAAGFCIRAFDTSMSNCYFDGEVQARRASGFSEIAYTSQLNGCYSNGTVRTYAQGAGFMLHSGSVNLSNCYSSCDVIDTNTDPNETLRTVIAGFIGGPAKTTISNCHFDGTVTGQVYSSGQFDTGYIVGAFVGAIDSDSSIRDSYIVHIDKSYAPDVIGFIRDQSDDMIIELKVYDSAIV